MHRELDLDWLLIKIDGRCGACGMDRLIGGGTRDRGLAWKRHAHGSPKGGVSTMMLTSEACEVRCSHGWLGGGMHVGVDKRGIRWVLGVMVGRHARGVLWLGGMDMCSVRRWRHAHTLAGKGLGEHRVM
ncbi:unnamed protein product [Dovyalis caffra]|uniref:Uncharacterized protein n=1 Tax=Dovyalis caffra TaxID=77055 RepID=A0AAV1QS38_9ROSI|nr:unnamed protein product [Dovyalis caffra]